MKKLLLVVLVATTFVLVGCHKAPKATNLPETKVVQKKCKSKKPHHRHHGKLGVEKTTEDTIK